MNLFNSWVLFYMSRIFSFAALRQPCPLRRNSSGFGEEGEVEKQRDLGRGENRKEGHELEDKRKSRGLQRAKRGDLPCLAGLSKAMSSQILNVSRQHPTRTFGAGRP